MNLLAVPTKHLTPSWTFIIVAWAGSVTFQLIILLMISQITFARIFFYWEKDRKYSLRWNFKWLFVANKLASMVSGCISNSIRNHLLRTERSFYRMNMAVVWHKLCCARRTLKVSKNYLAEHGTRLWLRPRQRHWRFFSNVEKWMSNWY